MPVEEELRGLLERLHKDNMDMCTLYFTNKELEERKEHVKDEKVNTSKICNHSLSNIVITVQAVFVFTYRIPINHVHLVQYSLPIPVHEQFSWCFDRLIILLCLSV